MEGIHDSELTQPSGLKIICVRNLSNIDCEKMSCKRFPLCPINLEKKEEK